MRRNTQDDKTKGRKREREQKREREAGKIENKKGKVRSGKRERKHRK
jgi:hypothetical protein